jgi:hypothetical protein
MKTWPKGVFMMILEKLVVRSCETVSCFLKQSFDLNGQLLRGEIRTGDYVEKVGEIWTHSAKDFWDPKEDR